MMTIMPKVTKEKSSSSSQPSSRSRKPSTAARAIPIPPLAPTAKSSEKIIDSNSDTDPDSDARGDVAPFIDNEAEETEDEDDGVGSDGEAQGAGGALRSDSSGLGEGEDVDMDAPDVDLRASARRGKEKELERASKRKERRAATYAPYVPPPGLLPLPEPSISFASSPFEWDRLAAAAAAADGGRDGKSNGKRGLELWCVRIPGGMRTSRLSSLQIKPSAIRSLDNARHRASSRPIGTLKTSTKSYTLRSATTPHAHEHGGGGTDRPASLGEGMTQSDDPTLRAERANDLGEREVTEVGLKASTVEFGAVGSSGGAGGGEEMFGLRLMVPRVGGEGRGRLFIAPKPITRHFILTPDISPIVDGSNTSSDPTLSTSLVPGYDDLVPSIAHGDDSLTGAITTTANALAGPPNRKRKHVQPVGKLVARNVPFGGLVSVKRQGAAMTVDEAQGARSGGMELAGTKAGGGVPPSTSVASPAQRASSPATKKRKVKTA